MHATALREVNAATALKHNQGHCLPKLPVHSAFLRLPGINIRRVFKTIAMQPHCITTQCSSSLLTFTHKIVQRDLCNGPATAHSTNELHQFQQNSGLFCCLWSSACHKLICTNQIRLKLEACTALEMWCTQFFLTTAQIACNPL